MTSKSVICLKNASREYSCSETHINIYKIINFSSSSSYAKGIERIKASTKYNMRKCRQSQDIRDHCSLFRNTNTSSLTFFFQHKFPLSASLPYLSLTILIEFQHKLNAIGKEHLISSGPKSQLQINHIILRYGPPKQFLYFNF